MDSSGSSNAHGARHRRPRTGGSGIALMSCAMAASLVATAPAWADPATPDDAPPGVRTLAQGPAVVAGSDALRIVRVDAASGLVPPAVPVVVDAVPGGSVDRSPDGSAGPARVSPVRSVALPVSADRIQIGNLDLRRPGSVPPDLAAQITAGSGDIVRGVSDVLRSNGVSAARADKVAEQMVGDAVVGGVIGGAVAAPVGLAVGAVVGGGLGLLFGIPFLPTGLVVGPVVGTALVAGMVAAPAVAAGMVIGAATGYQKGWTVPLDRPAPRHAAPAAAEQQVSAPVTPRPVTSAETVTRAPRHARVVPTPPVKVVERAPAAGQGPADCSVIRMAEVALAGGGIGSCQMP